MLYRRLLLGLLLLALLASLPALIHRVRAEQASRTVELVVDVNGYAKLAADSGVDLVTYLGQLRQAGATALGVSEESLADLAKRGHLVLASGGTVAGWLATGRVPAGWPADLTRATVSAAGTYAVVSDPAFNGWLGRALVDTQGPGVVRTYAGRQVWVYALPGDRKTVAKLPVGFYPPDFQPLASLGLPLALAMHNSPGLGAGGVATLFADATASTAANLVFFTSSSVVGAPGALSATATAMNQRDIVLGTLETSDQLGNVAQTGLQRLSALVGGRVVRVFDEPSWMVLHRPADFTVDSLVEAVESRNMRVLWLHPQHNGILPGQATAGNVALLANLASRLRATGYGGGQAGVLPDVTVPVWELVLMGWGAVAGALLLLDNLFPRTRRTGVLLLVLGLVLVPALLLVSHRLAPSALALLAAVTFPSLAVERVASRYDSWAQEGRVRLSTALYHGVVAAVDVLLVTLVGAALVGAMLGNTAHMLEWQYFRGVKLVYLLPPLLALVSYLVWVGPSGRRAPGRRADFWAEARWAWEWPVKLGALAVMGLVALAGLLYLVRSGNVTSALVPAIETQMRYALERLLIYRPRTKEFLIGYPALVASGWFAAHRRTGWYLLALLGGSVAAVSVQDAFAHIRTPFLGSLWRSGNGLALGLALGLVGTTVLALAWRWWEARGASTSQE